MSAREATVHPDGWAVGILAAIDCAAVAWALAAMVHYAWRWSQLVAEA